MDIIHLKNEINYETGFHDFDIRLWHSDESSLGIKELTSPEVVSPFALWECIPSWNVVCGKNGWAEIFVRGRSAEKWTSWYPMAFWSPEGSLTGRFSFSGQEDESGAVKTDCLVFKEEMESLQMKIRLGESRKGGMPQIEGAFLTWSTHTPGRGPGKREDLSDGHYKKTEITPVPAHSQMIYADGGNVWCSPTCVSMVLSYWRGGLTPPGACVREAVTGVFDPVYNGHGNWSFNAAWAGSQGYKAYVRRFTRLSQLQLYLDQGVPLVLSLSFNKEQERPLDGAPMNSSGGHLTLIKGFDGEGNALMNEPASSSDSEVPREYSCQQLEARWLESSGGVCYVIYPKSRTVQL